MRQRHIARSRCYGARVEQPAPARELLGELAEAELCAGDDAAAARHLRARLRTAGTDAERAADVKHLSRAVMQLDGAAAAARVLDDALAEDPGEGRLELESERLWIAALDPRSGPGLLSRLARWRLGGTGHAELAMLAALGVGLSLDPARAEAAGELLERAFADRVLLDGEGFESPLYALAAYALLASDRVQLAEAEMTRALGATHARGCAGGVAMALTVRGLARLRLGRIEAAESDGLAACSAAEGAAGTLRVLTFAAAVGVVVDARAERGDDAEALAS